MSAFSLFKRVFPMLAIGLCQAGLFSGPVRAASPVGCQGCGVAVAPLTQATVIKSGSVVLFDVSVANAIPSACDIDNATVTFYCPGLDGLPDHSNPRVLTTTLSLPFGASQSVATGLPCTVTTTSSGTAQVEATVSGAPGSCKKSAIDSASGTGTTSVVVTHPCLDITKNCPPNGGCTLYGQPIVFTGSVINCGDEAFEVTLSDVPTAQITPAGKFTVAAHSSVSYTGSYTPTSNLCGPLSDTITATATTLLTGTPLSKSATASCPVCNHPAISVTKTCGVTTTVLGQSYTVSGSVKNTGDTPLSGIVVNDTVTDPAGTVTHIAIPIPGVLAPGATAPIPTQTITPTLCGPNLDQFDVTANPLCGGTAVTARSAVCTTTITSTPGITVSKTCGPGNLVLGQSYTVSGSVQNTGNTPLSNIVVTDTITDANGVVTSKVIATIPGPLAPVAIVNFGPSPAITPTLCGSSTDQFSVTAVDSCGSRTSADSAKCTTQVTSTPAMTLVKICGPASITLGDSYTVSGTVQNTGNTPLTNIAITDTVTDANGISTSSVIATIAGPIAPTATASFGPSAVIKPTICGPNKDRLSATATDACSVNATALSAECTTQVISTPGLTVTKVCGPATIVLGQSYTASGSVMNTGTTALNNIVVTDTIVDAQGNSTSVILTTIPGPLAAGATVGFGPSAPITPLLCGPSKDRLSVTATDACGARATGESAECTTTVTSTPGITVTKVCGPASIVLGSSYTVSGTVVNTGNTPLGNIVITDTITDANGVSTSIVLATIQGPINPQVPTNFGPSPAITPVLCGASNDQLSVVASDACGKPARAQSAICTTQVTSTPGIEIIKVCGPETVTVGQPYTVSGTVHNTGDTALHNVVVVDTINDVQGNSTSLSITITGTIPAGGTAPIPSQTITPVLCGPGTDQFTVTAVDACGKQTSASSRVCTTVANSAVKVSVNHLDLCAGTSGQLTAVATGTVGSLNYAWTGPAGTGPFANTATITVSVAGTYNVTVTDANGCSGSGAGSVSINPNPIVTIADVIVCQGKGTLTATVGGITATPIHYVWTGPSGTGPFADAPSITVIQGGTYNVVVTDGNGCVGRASGKATVDHLTCVLSPQICIICPGMSRMFFATPIGAVGPVTYLWSNGATTPTISVTEAGIYTVTVTDSLGCSSSCSGQVIIDNFACGIDPDATQVCQGTAATLSALHTGGLAPYYYLWSTGESTTSIVVTTPGIYTLTVADANGCVDTFTAVVRGCTQCVTRPATYWFSQVIPPPRNTLSCATLQAAFGSMPNGLMNLGFMKVNMDGAIGLFWGEQTKTGTGERSGVCAARKTLSIQLMSAIANVTLLNDDSSGCGVLDPNTGEFVLIGTLIQEAQAATRTTVGLFDCANQDAWISDMNNLASLLALFNDGGASLPLPGSLVSCGVGTSNINYIHAHTIDPTTKDNCACP